MNITDQFEKVGVFFAENRLVAILEELPVPPVPPIKSKSIAGEKAAHDRCDGHRAGLQEQMKMIGDKRPGKTGGGGVSQDAPSRSTKSSRS